MQGRRNQLFHCSHYPAYRCSSFLLLSLLRHRCPQHYHTMNLRIPCLAHHCLRLCLSLPRCSPGMFGICYLRIESGRQCIGLNLSTVPSCNYSGMFLSCMLCILKNLSVRASTGLSQCMPHSRTIGMMNRMSLIEFHNSRMIVFRFVPT